MEKREREKGQGMTLSYLFPVTMMASGEKPSEIPRLAPKSRETTVRDVLWEARRWGDPAMEVLLRLLARSVIGEGRAGSAERETDPTPRPRHSLRRRPWASDMLCAATCRTHAKTGGNDGDDGTNVRGCAFPGNIRHYSYFKIRSIIQGMPKGLYRKNQESASLAGN